MTPEGGRDYYKITANGTRGEKFVEMSPEDLFTTQSVGFDLSGKILYLKDSRGRDGLGLVSYLTLPAGYDFNIKGKLKKPVPLLLWVHGGPWDRDSYGYNWIHQWMANRGYGVLIFVALPVLVKTTSIRQFTNGRARCMTT